MAVTSIWPIKGRVDKVINYARNPEKTHDKEKLSELHEIEGVVEYAADEMKTEKRAYVTCLNLHSEETAAQEFMETKRLMHNEGGRSCYHGYQSFKADEVDADTAHSIGVALARELWGDRFQVVIATHCNTGHYHNHFVINSVSDVDGKKFYNSPADYRRMREVSDRLCREAKISVMVPQNVAMKVDRPRKNSFQPTFLDAEQMQKLFEIVKGTRLELPVLVAAFYGLRRGEVLGLKWDAIDFNRGTLTIKRTVTEATIDGTMKIIEQDSAKTKSSLRTLPLVGSFRDYFQKVKEAQELNKKVCGNCYNYDYDGYVFVNELGERMRPNYLTEYFPKYIAKHGMPKMRFHDLRHSCASLLLANGVPLKQIQEWLGHSDFSTTANIYAHLDYRSKISSAQAMEQGMLLPRSDDFGSRWEDVTEQGKITEPDLNPGF